MKLKTETLKMAYMLKLRNSLLRLSGDIDVRVKERLKPPNPPDIFANLSVLGISHSGYNPGSAFLHRCLI